MFMGRITDGISRTVEEKLEPLIGAAFWAGFGWGIAIGVVVALVLFALLRKQ
jgi:hypothetical protein